VGLAGPLANFALAVVFAHFLNYFPINSPTFDFFKSVVGINLSLMVFNLVPLPPLDGSKLLYALWPASVAQALATLERYSFVALIIFIFYGSKFLTPIIAWLYALIT
jgi:Zn-dependent protease